MLWWCIATALALVPVSAGIGEELVEPDELELSSTHTVLSVEKCVWNVSGDLAALQTRCYCYDLRGQHKCSIPGPTLVFKNGKDGFIRLQNRLTGERRLNLGNNHKAADMISHDPDVINLHVHGLHVSPLVDDVIDRWIDPNKNCTAPNYESCTLDYNYSIPTNHYPGLHWYHDHWHGAVTLHVHGGLVGALKVKPANESIIEPALANMTNRTLVFHGLTLDKTLLHSNGTCDCAKYRDNFDIKNSLNVSDIINLNIFQLTTICAAWCDMYCHQREHSDTPPNQSTSSLFQSSLAASDGSIINWDGGKTFLLVNNQVKPKITIKKNEWLRLFLVNADAQGSMFLDFDRSPACQYYYIAADGIFFNKSRDLRNTPYEHTYFLSMGGRAEILVKCNATGSYKVNIVSKHRNTTIQNHVNCLPTYMINATLFTIEVAGSNEGGSSSDPMAFKFPLKTGYIEDTLNVTAQNEACTNYNATEMYSKDLYPHHLGWTIHPDAGNNSACSKTNFTFPNGESAIIYGKLFGINGQYFRHDISLATLEFDRVYQMDVAFFPHPFHHHINPFQFTTDLVYGFLGQKGEWRDVVSPSCENGLGIITVRTRTRDFKGRVIMHCHYLPHEDRGLMGYYFINDTCTKSDDFSISADTDFVQCGTSNVGDICGKLPSGSLVANPLPAILFALFVSVRIQLL